MGFSYRDLKYAIRSGHNPCVICHAFGITLEEFQLAFMQITGTTSMIQPIQRDLEYWTELFLSLGHIKKE